MRIALAGTVAAAPIRPWTPIAIATALPFGGWMASLIARADAPVVCPFRICTGHACMGCGLTRSVGALFRGDLELSLRYHPLAIVFAAQAIIIAALMVIRPTRTSAALAERSLALVYANVFVLMAIWVLRWRFGLLDFVISS